MKSVTLATAILGLAASAAASELGRRVVDVLEDFRDRGNSIAYSEELVPPTMRVNVEPTSTIALQQILEILKAHDLTLDAVEGVFVVIPIDARNAPSGKPSAPVQTKVSLDNITVSASRYEVDRDATSSSVAIAQQAIDDMPDVGSDPVRISQRLPGVAASGASARAHFRGGELNEIGIILNGHRLFDPFHVRDYQSIFSTIDARAIEGVEIYTGSFPVQFGNRMSGVVVLQSLDPDVPRHTEVGLSVFNTSFLTSNRSGDLHWLFSARRGNLDQVIDKKFGQPSYYDVFSQLEVGVGRNSVLSGNILYADDVVSIVLETDAEEREEIRSTTRSLQTWLQLRTDWSSELQSLTALSYTEYGNHRLGSTNDPDKVVARVDDDRDVVETSVRQDWTFQPRESHRLQWGYGVSKGDAVFRYGGQAEYNGLPALFQDQPRTLTRDVNVTPDGSRYFAYVADRWRISPATILEFGLRWDDQTYASRNSDSQLSPRIGLLRRWNNKLDVRLSWGRYHQAQGIHELQVEDGVRDYWPAQRADQYIASLQYPFDGGTTLRVEAFHKRMQKVRPRFENLFDPLALIPELQADRVRLQPSRASASGVEVSMTGSHGELNWWSSYTLSRVRDRIDGRTEPRSWDQRHAVNAGLSWSNANWDLSLAASVHSGWPTTGLMLVDVAGQQEPVAVPGSRNALRLGRFASIDFRINRRFEFRRGTFSTFFEVSNTFNRRNTCCIDWDIDDSNGDIVLENSADYWLPLLPAIGFLWEFQTSCATGFSLRRGPTFKQLERYPSTARTEAITMKVFVISLPDSGERRRSAQQQLDRAGIPFEFFDAIRGDIAIRDCIFEGFDETSYLLNTGRHAVIGEIGCFASHRELWRHCVELNEPIVIFEDDFNVLPQFKNALRAAASIISTVGFVRLQTTLRAKQAKIAEIDGFQLGRFVKAPHGMMCYCLSPKVARHFLEETRVIHAPVDVFMKKYWEHGQPLYALTPFTVSPSVLSVETTIEGRNKGRKSFRTAQRRLRRKANWYLQRWLFNLRMRLQRSPVATKPLNPSEMREPVSSSR